MLVSYDIAVSSWEHISNDTMAMRHGMTRSILLPGELEDFDANNDTATADNIKRRQPSSWMFMLLLTVNMLLLIIKTSYILRIHIDKFACGHI